jgi:hypothetical protein
MLTSTPKSAVPQSDGAASAQAATAICTVQPVSVLAVAQTEGPAGEGAVKPPVRLPKASRAQFMLARETAAPVAGTAALMEQPAAGVVALLTSAALKKATKLHKSNKRGSHAAACLRWDVTCHRPDSPMAYWAL